MTMPASKRRPARSCEAACRSQDLPSLTPRTCRKPLPWFRRHRAPSPRESLKSGLCRRGPEVLREAFGRAGRRQRATKGIRTRGRIGLASACLQHSQALRPMKTRSHIVICAFAAMLSAALPCWWMTAAPQATFAQHPPIEAPRSFEGAPSAWAFTAAALQGTVGAALLPATGRRSGQQGPHS